jgi:hypothetical protein
MTDIETRGAGRIDEIEVRDVPHLVCAVCGLDVCGHQDRLKVVREGEPLIHGGILADLPTRYVADRKPIDYDNGITAKD